MTVRTPLAILLAAMVLVAALSAVAADPAERTLQLDPQLEKGLETAVAYIAVEYTKPNTGRRFIESGTGFFVTPTNLITNQHVIRPALTSQGSANIKVRVYSGTPQARVLTAQIVKHDAEIDLALLAVEGEVPAITPVQIHPDLPGKQTGVYAFGFPLGTMLDRSLNGPNVCLRRGYVSRLINDGKNIEADLNIDKGISGGPLVDEEGVVRGVVRAMAGSEHNKSFAAISVSSPVLLEFCQTSGLAVTLKGGRQLQPGSRVLTSAAAPVEPAARPRAGLGQDLVRAFFTIGSALRLSALVPAILVKQNQPYTLDLRQSSRNNADLVLAGLQRVQAPAELIQRARELSVLLGDTGAQPRLAREKSLVLEEACDEWSQRQAQGESLNYGKLNYDLGAWLTELSLGLLDLSEGKDSRACAFFLEAARSHGGTAEIIGLLARLESNLLALEKQDDDSLRRTVSKDADRLIGIGYLATTASSNNALPKPALSGPNPGTPRNPIRYPL